MSPNRWSPLPRLRATFLAALAVLAAAVFNASAWATTPPYSEIGHFSQGISGEAVGVAVDQSSQDVYVASPFSFNGSATIDKFEANGMHLLSFGSFGSGVTVDQAVNRQNNAAGDVYVLENKEEKIETYSADGTLLSSFSVAGSKSFYLGTIAQIAADSAGNVYVPNPPSNEVQVFSPAGTGAELYAPYTGAGTGTIFSKPLAVAVDSAGDIYVADTGNNRIVKIEHGTGAESVFATGAEPQSVAVDSSTGKVYVGYYNSELSCSSLSPPCFHIAVYEASGHEIEDFGAGLIESDAYAPYGVLDSLAVDEATHDLYVVAGGTSKREVMIFAPVVVPEATTHSASGVSASEAMLNGEVNPKGAEAFCHFEWGTTESYGNTAPCEPELAGEGLKAKAVHARIAGLEGNTTYHFRLVAENAGHLKVYGEDESFSTPQVPPTLTTMRTSEVTQSDVVFGTVINPQHLDTHWWVDYSNVPLNDSAGTCTPGAPYASSPASPTDMGEGSTPEAITLDLAPTSVVLHPGMASRELKPNTAYHFQVVAENSAGTSCGQEAAFVTLPPAPSTSTGAASRVTQRTASVAGTVNPGSYGANSDTTWWFEYGVSTSYGTQLPVKVGDAGMGETPVAISTSLEGLAPNTTYHYRIVASNANEDAEAKPCAKSGDAECAPQVTFGKDATFTTLPVEPLAGQTTIGGSPGEVMLQGHVNATGHPLQYRFEYGATTAYGSSTQLAFAGEGTEYAEEVAKLTGLAPGTYHWRVAAVGAGGTVYSADATFTVYGPASAPVSNPFTAGSGSAEVLPAMPLLSVPSFPAPPEEVAKPPAKKPKLSCQAKAKRIKNATKRTAALKRCAKAKRKGKSSRARESTKSRGGHHL